MADTSTLPPPTSAPADQFEDEQNDAKKRKQPPNGGDDSHTNEEMARQDTEETALEQQQRPLTQEGERPQKKFYRQRAHCNPLSHNDSFAYPLRPRDMDWTLQHYPKLAGLSDAKELQPTVLDIGCGFGGLTMALGEILPPTTIVLGMEIRAKVAEYVRLRIVAARNDSDSHHNVSVLRTNSQKFLVNYFSKHSMDKLFFCFPDPHFKRKNHPRRIISDRLLAEYAYVLKPGTGKLYCITDVKELHEWHVQKCNAHPLLEIVSDEENEADPCVAAMITKTEEGQKVERNKGSKYHAVYRRIRIEQEESLQFTSANFFGAATAKSIS